MKSLFLLPNKWKKYGWILLMITIAYIAVGFITQFYYYYPITFVNYNSLSDWKQIQNIMNIEGNILTTLSLISLFIIALSKEKIEDEYIHHLRLNSFGWAIVVNAIYYWLALVLLNRGIHLLVGLNLFIPLIIYIGRFKYLLLRAKRS